MSPDTGETGLGGALSEPARQDYVGGRDLTRWPTTAGRVAANLALRAARWVAPHWLLALTLLAGLVLVGMLTAVAAEVYDAVVEADGIAVLDQPVLDAVRALRSPPLNAAVIAFTNLGGPVGMSILATSVAVVLAVVWRQWTPVLLMAATAAGSLAMTTIGKTVVGRSRPPSIDAVPPFEHGYSFPSGHTLNAVALAGIVAYLLVRRQRRAWVRTATVATAAGFAFLMGLSRVYLGLHWLTDVVVAWALGLAWLVTVITAHRLFLTVRDGTGAGPIVRRTTIFSDTVYSHSMVVSEQAFLILSALADRPRHGYALITEVAAMTDGRVRLRAGTLYGAPDRLAGQGLVAADREEIENGRLRRYHRLTDAGAEALRMQGERMAATARLATERLALRPRLGGAG